MKLYLICLLLHRLAIIANRRNSNRLNMIPWIIYNLLNESNTAQHNLNGQWIMNNNWLEIFALKQWIMNNNWLEIFTLHNKYTINTDTQFSFHLFSL